MTGAVAMLGGAIVPTRRVRAGAEPELEAGEATVDITPPSGTELGGFHRRPGQERRVVGHRGRCGTRALVLRRGETLAAVCSLDMMGVSQAMADRIRRAAARQTGIPAADIRVSCTHTHSMPASCTTRQWGSIPERFMREVEHCAVEAIGRARADLAPAELLVGKSRAAGGNHNRTTKTFRTDAEFDGRATDAERWLDTTLHAMLLPRAGKPTLLWYHFSAHAVCHADDIAGPDWPGVIALRTRETDGFNASFLQGHCGDVNPGDGKDWRGEINQTVAAIRPALKQAIADAVPVRADALRSIRVGHRIPYNVEMFRAWVDEYRRDPKACVRGPWVDAGFAEDWYRGNAGRTLADAALPVELSALRVGDVALVFHPAELYSYYGLALRRSSPFSHTLVVGYTDGLIGYLTDPTAYRAGEYAAITVPKILDLPPFAESAARGMTAAAEAMLRQLAS